MSLKIHAEFFEKVIGEKYPLKEMLVPYVINVLEEGVVYPNASGSIFSIYSPRHIINVHDIATNGSRISPWLHYDAQQNSSRFSDEFFILIYYEFGIEHPEIHRLFYSNKEVNTYILSIAASIKSKCKKIKKTKRK